MIYPPRLKKGDTVGVISPASSPEETDFKRGISIIEQLGLKVKIGQSTLKRNGYLAGTDRERLADFHDMIKDDNVKAIVFARGGYGTARITSQIDFNLIRHNPKIIWGYSDITYLHTAIRQKANLITFHGPMIVSIGKKSAHFKTKQTFNQLFKPMDIVYDERIAPLHIINEGKTSGKLVGGNLSLLTSSIGTPYEIDLNKRILFIEDVDEPPYKIDSMLNQLLQSNKLKNVKGIIIGDFKLPKYDEFPERPLEIVFKDYFKRLNIPVMSGFKIGHCEPNIAIPLGTNATMCTKTKTLKVESGVS